MIQITITYRCNNCNSNNIVKNGYNKCGNAQYHCKDCGVYRVLEPHQPYSEAMRQTILRAYKERASLRGLERIFKVSRQIISAWIKAYARRLPHLRATVDPARPDDVLELDEMWSFVGSKAEKRWLWMVMCRRTRQIVAFVIGGSLQSDVQTLVGAGSLCVSPLPIVQFTTGYFFEIQGTQRFTEIFRSSAKLTL